MQCITKFHGKHSFKLNRPAIHQKFEGQSQLCVSNALEVQKCQIGSKFDHVKSMVLIMHEDIYS